MVRSSRDSYRYSHEQNKLSLLPHAHFEQCYCLHDPIHCTCPDHTHWHHNQNGVNFFPVQPVTRSGQDFLGIISYSVTSNTELEQNSLDGWLWKSASSHLLYWKCLYSDKEPCKVILKISSEHRSCTLAQKSKYMMSRRYKSHFISWIICIPWEHFW